jgi:hypothetical protein
MKGSRMIALSLMGIGSATSFGKGGLDGEHHAFARGPTHTAKASTVT